MKKQQPKPKKTVQVLKSKLTPVSKTTTRATKDSTSYFNKQADENLSSGRRLIGLEMTTGKKFGSDKALKRGVESTMSAIRQSYKGKSGYDANGYPLKKK